ncbi:peroxiredoxin [Spirosoma lacussanchae]
MKNYLYLLLFILFTGMTYKILDRLAVRKETSHKIHTLPSVASAKFTALKPMLHGKPSIVIFFDPDCELCHREATQIRQQQAAFANTSVYWLTTQSLTKARAFAHQYGLDTLSMMHVGALTREEAYQAFGPTSVPHIFIYGADKRLRKEYKGEVKVEALLKYL